MPTLFSETEEAGIRGFGWGERLFAGNSRGETAALPRSLISGSEGNDNLAGTSGADNIFGLGGNDDVQGFNGNDVLFGGAGIDNLQGGAGDDLIFGGAGDDGRRPGALLEGAAGNDVIFGGEGNDVLSGDDTAHPAVTGTDRLFGGNGRDQLTGGPGEDVLEGGANDDLYVFTSGSGEDLLTDFTAGSAVSEDVLNLVDYPVDGLEDLVITQTNVGAHVAFGAGDGVLLIGVAAADLAAQDFAFV